MLVMVGAVAVVDSVVEWQLGGLALFAVVQYNIKTCCRLSSQSCALVPAGCLYIQIHTVVKLQTTLQ